MATLLYRLGRGSFRHRGIVLTVWIALLAGFGLGAAFLSGPSTSSVTIPGTEAQRALDSLATEFPGAAGGSGSIVIAAPDGGTVTSTEGQAAIAAIAAEASLLPDVAAVLDPAQTGQVSPDESIAVVRVQFTKPVDELAASTKEAFNAIGAAVQDEGFTVAHGGDIASGEPAIGGAEGIGVLIAALVLVLTFGSLVAAGMTLLTALIGLGVGVAGLYSLSGIVSFSSITPILALMLGLAVGIDYSLFIVSRHRHNLLEGMRPDEAAGRAVATAGSAVVFAGATVIIALAGLTVVGIGFLAKMGLAAAATVLVAVLVALTLSPALLGFAGRRVLPRKLRDPEAARAALGDEESPKLLGRRWAEFVTHHRAVVLIVGVLGLGALSIPVLSMQTSLPDAGHAPAESTARIAYDLTTRGFGEGSNGPLVVVVDATSPDTLAADAATVTQLLTDTPGVVVVTPPTISPSGTTALLQVVPATGPSDPATADLVHAIRDRVAGSSSATVSVTGFTAVGVDVSQKLADALPIYLLLVIGLSFVLLMVMFRSILVPLKATLGFLLTVGATFGIAVAVFQWGWLSETVGLSLPGPLLSFMPILIIGILFGLAMDYEVFLVSRMREDFVHGASAREATVSGFSHGARVVTAAAAIMISIFAAFVFSEDSTIKSMGFGLATGVAIDAFIVRMTLVPAAMSLLGDRAWWLPGWLGRLLPDVDIEGKNLRADDDAAPAGEPVAKAV
ncbi:MMPL family transporter [Pengzhenrongella frigida]|uniref:MMPL family transporter n=1 Tax=Pengzhenrongella frigida TaxID=1259133 RepID=A0A4Q5N0Y3_9MICO|nr:MMPL family transporter [Cellulomonas sp. HLT2-17]RYV51710.1 MMPL family transporter [Cellulomonas sp. HLT2-17]